MQMNRHCNNMQPTTIQQRKSNTNKLNTDDWDNDKDPCTSLKMLRQCDNNRKPQQCQQQEEETLIEELNNCDKNVRESASGRDQCENKNDSQFREGVRGDNLVTANCESRGCGTERLIGHW